MHPDAGLGVQFDEGRLVTVATGRRSALVSVTTHLPPAIADELRQAAAARGLSLSAAAAVLLAEALRADVEHKHGALLEAAVERTIREAMGRHLERIGELAFRGALHSDELRRQMRPLLAHLFDQETARTIRREAHSAAWQQLHEPLEHPNGAQVPLGTPLAAPPRHEDGAWPEAPGQS